MKSLHRISMLALLAFALPGIASAQRADSAARDFRGPLAALDRAPGETVLEYRTQLSLTAQQVAQIEQIRSRLRTQNEPLVARLRAAGYPTTEAERNALTLGQLRALRERSAELAPTLRELRANQAAASREIQNLLTLEQYTRLRDLARAELRAATAQRGVGRALPGPRTRGIGRGFRI